MRSRQERNIELLSSLKDQLRVSILALTGLNDIDNICSYFLQGETIDAEEQEEITKLYRKLKNIIKEIN